jgi:hypothetical protein
MDRAPRHGVALRVIRDMERAGSAREDVESSRGQRCRLFSIGSVFGLGPFPSPSPRILGRLRDRQRDQNEPRDCFLGRPRGRLQAQHEDFCKHGLPLTPTAPA